jgi:hypothetical protein
MYDITATFPYFANEYLDPQCPLVRGAQILMTQIYFLTLATSGKIVLVERENPLRA